MESRFGVEVGSCAMNFQHPIKFGLRSAYRGETPFLQFPEDARFHTYIVGKSGSGKSTLLKNLIAQHIQQGAGIALIDPHGDLSEELLALVPKHRIGQVTYFNPSDAEYPVAFNPLAGVPLEDRPLAASSLVGAFKTIWGDSWGPRMAYILYNCVAALLDCPNVSLLGVSRMLIDARYRRWVVQQVQDPFVKQFWELEFESYDQRFMREAIAPIQNKVGALLQTPILRNILGQVKNKLSIPFVMDQRRIFIANLAKGRMGEDKSNLLGALLVSQFQLAAMARSSRPESERIDFLLVVDEFQNFATDAFASALSEARKYKLQIVLANQFLDQISPPVRAAVFGNVGNIIAFRVGYADAELLSKEFANEVRPDAFVDLPRFRAWVKVMENSEPQVTFKASFSKAPDPLRKDITKLVKLSRQRFSTPRAIVEHRMRRWLRLK